MSTGTQVARITERVTQAPYEVCKYRGFAIMSHWDGYRWQHSQDCFQSVSEVWKSIAAWLKAHAGEAGQ
jgi:uncharacterized Fe-S cluster protein YjdI